MDGLHWDRPKERHTVVRAAGVTLVFVFFFLSFCKRIPKINANQKKPQQPTTPPPPPSAQLTPHQRQKQTKKNPEPKLEEGEGVGGAPHPSICLFSFRAAALARPPSLWNCVAWTEGWKANDRPLSSPPPFPPPAPASALWSWMERNANDLTELKSSKNKNKETRKKSLFLFFCWLVLIV